MAGATSFNEDVPRYERGLSLAGQKAIVTGASSGIGQAVAAAIGRAGAEVVVNFRSDEKGANETIRRIEDAGGRAFPFKADVSEEGEVERLFAETIERLGTVDILVNNAGLQQDAAFEDMTIDQWRKVIDVNLTGQFLCARAAIREFLRRGVKKEVSVAAGKIVCVSSVHEVIPWAGHVNYAASKGGVLLMMKSLALEYAWRRIRINSVAPGAIRTPINKEAWGTAEAYASLMRLVPYQRIGETEDVAQAVLWLASDLSDYVNGTTLFVDGGMTCYPGFESGG